ncbi:MAG: MBL fold metallo-hydrolase [Candidatus Eisenbacteria bacterium]|nr:MBL fold metallo-hydrolase [Candidatus Eisenbacteria bacterium]
MTLRKMVVGQMDTNCYILGCDATGEGAVIDPGGDADAIKSAIEDMGLTIRVILNTHGHVDHMAANAEMKRATGAELAIHEFDAGMLTDPVANLSSSAFGPVVSPAPDRLLAEGDTVKVGTLVLNVLHTPGHTQGGICLLGRGYVFTGDTLFAGSVGRSDFPGGDHTVLIHSVRTRLLCLADTTIVLPGHGPNTTIGNEKESNPFL